MAQLPIDEAINRFKDNEDRFDDFVNDSNGYNRDNGAFVESIPAFLARQEQEIEETTGTVEANLIASNAAKIAAESARDAAIIQAGVYIDEPTGRAAVADGVAFKVQGSADIAAYEYRRVNSSTSTLIAVYPSASIVDNIKNRVPQRSALGTLTPIVAFGGDLALWHEEGDGFNFEPSKSLVEKIGIFRLIDAILTPIVAAGGDILLTADQQGRLNFKPAPELVESISNDILLQVPSVTGGEFLHRTRAKIAAMRIGTAGARLNILLNGDSWTMLTPLRQALEDVIASGAVVDEGYVSAQSGQSKLTGFTQAYSAGWAFIDGTAGGLDYGVTPDGQCAHTTLTTETLTFAALRCTRFSIYCREHGGKWRYRVDGGVWNEVIDMSGGAFKRILITGLADTTHTIEIDTTGNAGRVVLAGFYAARDGIGGVQISRIGDGSSTAKRWIDYLPTMAAVIEQEPPDLIITCLGTNDARTNTSTTTIYLQYMTDLITTARANMSDTDMLHIVGPQNNLSVVRPTTDYRDALWEVRDALRSEYLSLSEYFGTWEQANALGLWADDVHPSSVGARMISDLLNDNLTRI